jgi:group I intron endonuclease
MANAFEVTFVLYRATCRVTGKVYIGQTSQLLKKRWAHHCHMAKTGKGNGCSAFHAAVAKYGPDQFDLVTLGAFKSREALNAAEAASIAAHNSISPNGYNLKAGGKASAHSAETRAKMSAARKKQGNFRKGVRLSAETRERMSVAQKATDRSYLQGSLRLARHWEMR